MKRVFTVEGEGDMEKTVHLEWSQFVDEDGDMQIRAKGEDGITRCIAYINHKTGRLHQIFGIPSNLGLDVDAEGKIVVE